MAEAKIYVGSCKEISTQYGTIMKIEFSKKHLETLLANLNERGYAKVAVAPRKEIGQYGDTHTVSIDTYVAPVKDVQPDAPEDVPVKQEELTIDNLPF